MTQTCAPGSAEPGACLITPETIWTCFCTNDSLTDPAIYGMIDWIKWKGGDPSGPNALHRTLRPTSMKGVLWKLMKIGSNSKLFKRVFVLIMICLVSFGIYIICGLRSSYSFDSLLRQESPAKIVRCSLDVCSAEDGSTLSIDVDSELFEHLLQILRSERYSKPLSSVLGSTVPAYHIEAYPFYRILLQHEDRHRTEVVVNGSFLLIGSTTGPGLMVYQISGDTSLLQKLRDGIPVPLPAG